MDSATGILQVGITVHSICTQFRGVRGTMGFREHGPSIRGHLLAFWSTEVWKHHDWCTGTQVPAFWLRPWAWSCWWRLQQTLIHRTCPLHEQWHHRALAAAGLEVQTARWSSGLFRGRPSTWRLWHWTCYSRSLSCSLPAPPCLFRSGTVTLLCLQPARLHPGRGQSCLGIQMDDIMQLCSLPSGAGDTASMVGL